MGVDDRQGIACRMDALTEAERGRHQALRALLESLVTSVEELPDGFRLHLPESRENLRLLADFVALERTCCPFLAFRIELEPEAGSLALALTGRAGVKEFLRSPFGHGAA